MRSSGPQRLRYWAFISYSHADREWADWLHRELENFDFHGAPAPMPPDIARGRRMRPVFLDHLQLPATHDLQAALQQSLRESMALIVICSPRAARSRRVALEIESFIAERGVEHLIGIVIEGPSGAACVPEILRRETQGPQARLLDATGKSRREVLYALVAALTGADAAELRHRSRRRNLLKFAAGCVLLAAVAAAGVYRHVSAQSSVSAEVRPWVGTWYGWTKSSCGYYSGDVSLVIEAAGKDSIHVTSYIQPGDHFAASVRLSVTGNTTHSAAGNPSLTMQGNKLVGVYLPACQRGEIQRQ